MADFRDPEKRMQMLDSEGRIKDLRPNDLIEKLAGITKGMTCVDLGCGTGAFAFPMVLSVGDKGIVYAVDKNAYMLERIRAKNPPPNLILLLCDANQTGLGSHIADFCLIALVLHELEQPYTVMSEAFRLLKPDGTLVVVEWKAEPDVVRGPSHVNRLYREQIERLFKRAGFSRFKYIDWTKNYYVTEGFKKKID